MVLDHDRQLELVAVVEESRRRWPDLERQPRGDGRLGRTEALGAFDRHGHHPVTRQIVGHLELDGQPPRGVGNRIRFEQRQGVEVVANVDGQSGRRLPTGIHRGFRGGYRGKFHRFLVVSQVLSELVLQPLGALEQDRASNDSSSSQARGPGTVEDLDGIEQFVSRDGQHRLVHGDQKDIGTLDRLPAGIVDLHRDARGGTRLNHRRCGRGRDFESPLHGWDPQHDLPGRVGRSGRCAGEDGAVVGGPVCRGDKIYPQSELGDVLVADRHFQNRGVVGYLEGA